MNMETFQLQDGRILSFYQYGDMNGCPVFFSHGLGDSGLIKNPDDSIVNQLGLRIISPNMPGVGDSSPMKNRTLKDWADDIRQLANHLGIEKYVSAGHSAGTAHAAAVAYYNGDSVEKLVLASALQTVDNNPDVKDAFIPEAFKMLYSLHKWHLDSVTSWMMNVGTASAPKDIDKYIAEMITMDKSDGPTFLNPEFNPMFKKSFATGVAQKGVGMFEMLDAVWNWGFNAEDIEIPTTIFYSLHDDLIKPEFPIGLSKKIANSKVVEWDVGGHYAFVETENWKQFTKEMSS